MFKKILSAFLAVCMLGSVAVVAASAEETPEKTFNYVALGDSIAAGYGLSEPVNGLDPALILSEDLIADPVKEAYAYVLGERLAALGAEYGCTTTATNLASTAYRAEDVAATITTPGFKGGVATSILEGFVGKGASAALVPYHDIYNKYLPNADMVSIQLGGNDIVMGIIYPVYAMNNPILTNAGLSVTLLLFGLPADQAIGYGVQQLIKQKDSITKEQVAEAAKYMASIVKDSEKFVQNAANNVEGVVNAVRSVNTTADIALVGMYNPYGNSLEYDGQVRDVCHVVQNIFARAASEVFDCNISVGGLQLNTEDAEEKAEELDDIADELTKTPFKEICKAKVQALVTIAAEEMAYPIQYLTAGKSSDPQMKLLNSLLQDIAVRNDATYVNVYDISNECNTDPHPTAKGHKEIADRLEATMMDKILSRMDPTQTENNGNLTIENVTTVQRYLAEFDIEGAKLKLADFSGDGTVNIADVTAMQRALAEIA